jgi:gliding motility associated protien GldN
MMRAVRPTQGHHCAFTKHGFFMIQSLLKAGALVALCHLMPCALHAQESEVPPEDTPAIPLDDFVHRPAITERQTLAWQPVREADILWEKRLWRVVDVREKINFAFTYPNAPFVDLLVKGVESEQMTVYSAEDDRFTKPLALADVQEMVSKTDTITRVNLTTYEEEIIIVHNNINAESIKRFRLKEAWFFDAKTATLRVRLLGIAPLMEVLDGEGNFLYERPLFWVHYPSARPYLARQKCHADGDNVALVYTWEDVFETRRFSSYIYKESETRDRRLQDYLAGHDLLMEGQKIEDELFNREHDLWSW